jgi:predicted lipoprotein with Yx(FWY)xxD motif
MREAWMHDQLTTNPRSDMTRTRSILLLAGVAAIALLAGACGSSGGGTSAASGTDPTTTAAPVAVNVASSGLGNILVDAQGRTLYLFGQDTGTTSTCTAACTMAWPPLRATGPLTAAGGADAALLGSSPRSDGAAQVTYNGHPVYTFIKDQQPGDTNGEGVTAFGGSWFAVSPTGTQVGPPAAPTTAPPVTAPPATRPPAERPPATSPPATSPPVTSPPATSPPTTPQTVPRSSGGDHDGDNNGGPDDGDGNQ